MSKQLGIYVDDDVREAGSSDEAGCCEEGGLSGVGQSCENQENSRMPGVGNVRMAGRDEEEDEYLVEEADAESEEGHGGAVLANAIARRQHMARQ